MMIVHGVIYLATLAALIAVSSREWNIRNEMKDALDWRNPEVAGVWSDMFRDPVKLYEQKYPDSELPKKFRKLARIKIGIVLLFVIEVAVLQR